MSATEKFIIIVPVDFSQGHREKGDFELATRKQFDTAEAAYEYVLSHWALCHRNLASICWCPKGLTYESTS